jgi:hypothetical protein
LTRNDGDSHDHPVLERHAHEREMLCQPIAHSWGSPR